MGYSNVAGDLNVAGTSTLSTLVVNGSTQHYGQITSTGSASFANVVANNFTVTGNFTVTATNTTVSNSLSIVNQGTTTALYVNQNEFPNRTYNVAEFWDHTDLAMVIDGYGNVAIHTSASINHALTVVDGALIDRLTLGTPLTVSSGGTGDATATQNYVFAGPSVGSAGAPSFRALVNADFPSYVVVSNVYSNGAAMYALNSSNLVGNVANANVALVVSQAAQPNITSVGTLTGLNVQGLLIASNGSGISNLNSSNLVGNVASANVALVVSQASQPNITSVGTLTGLNVQGLLIVSNGSGISNLNSSNLVGNVANANVALVVSQAAQTNITSVGTLTGLTVSGLLIASNGSGISNINGSNVSTVPTAQSVITAAQSNITSVGTLTGLTVSGLLIASNGSGISNINSSNLVGNVANSNVALVVSQAAQPNITSVGTLTGLTVSGLLIASNGSGISNINGSNVSTVPTAQSVIAAAQTNITSVGTLTGLTVSGLLIASNASGISNINGSNVSTVPTAQSVITAAQTNITSVGTLTGLTVSGLLIASNASGISNINGSNVSTVPTAQSVTVAAQTNITSVGTLTGLTVSGLLIASNASGISNVNGSNVSTVGTALSVTAAAQTNITSVGTLTSLVVQGTSNILAANIANIYTTNIVGFVGSQWTGQTGSTIYYINPVGIGTSTAGANLTVSGNIFASNALTTPSAFFTTATSTSLLGAGGFAPVTGGPTIGVTGNIFASNAITTPSAFFTTAASTSLLGAGGFTPVTGGAVIGITGNAFASNAFQTTNVVASGNVTAAQFIGVGGFALVAGNPTIGVTGNIYASNAITTPSAFFTTVASSLVGAGGFTPVTGGAVIGVTGNVYASNALQTTTVLGTSLIGTHYGVIAGSNTVSASTFTGSGASLTNLPLNQFTGLTAGGVAYGSATTTIATNSVGTSGQALLSGATGAPTWGTLGLANGGTGATSAQAAMNALAAAVTSGQYLRGNGTNVVMSAIQAADVPTLNQNTTGSAGSLSTTFTAGYVLYGQGTGVPNFNSGFTFTSGSGVSVTGYVQATGDLVAYFSDERLKIRTGVLENALDKVSNLSGFTFITNDLAKSYGYTDERQRVGVSAQEVQRVLPEAVSPAPFDTEDGKSKSGQDYLTVHYERLVPLLIEALKEERKTREALEDRVQKLEKHLNLG